VAFARCATSNWISVRSPCSSSLDDLRREFENTPPEIINDGPNTAPSKRLHRCFENYQKSVDGLLAMDADVLPDLRFACPRFGGWIARLEALGET
jgi:hypothetical protein